jgi:MFS transporter, Spinster family, sphingosine-1-phosphate transporter
VTVQRYEWRVFAVLWALMVVDYVDRQIVVSILPRLRSEWALSDTQLGSLVSIVPIIVALGSVPLSFLADRWSAVKSIFLMALVWSVATIACAFSANYGQMLGARGVVGLGEAAYGTAGAALVASLFPERVRTTMLGVFLGAAVFGSVLGVMLGGIITERWGWRAAFGIAGIPGVILAILFRLLALEHKTLPGVSDVGSTKPESGIVSQLLRPRTVLVTCVAGGLQLLVVSAMYAWLPSYLNRYHGLPAGQAGVKTGLVILIGGFGAILWSIIADRLTGRFACARLYVPAAAAVMTAMLLFGTFAWTAPGDYQFWLILAGGLVMTGSIGPAAAVIIDVSPPGLRATAASILAFSQNLVGLAGGPFLTGMLADAYGLRLAMSVVPVFSLLAAVMFALAARTYLADVQSIERGKPGVANFEPEAI